MIFYFTGTGNSYEAAKIIAEANGDSLVDIGFHYKYKEFDFTLHQGEDIGFVLPTHAWTTPPIVDSFLRKAHFLDEQGESIVPGYCYLVITCGFSVGKTAQFFADQLYRNQAIRLDASFSIETVGTCVSLYGPAEGEKRDLLLSEARRQAEKIAIQIGKKEKGSFEHKSLFGQAVSLVTGREEKPRPTKKFYTLPTCTHCNQCAEICPTNTITLIDGTPRWAELGCTQCYACIHRCPAHAIQYGKKTETRGRHVNPAILDKN